LSLRLNSPPEDIFEQMMNKSVLCFICERTKPEGRLSIFVM
jgi:hypothetical protein